MPNLLVEAAYVANRGVWWTAPVLDSEAYNTLTREIGKTEKNIAHTVGERFTYLLPGLLVALTGLGFIAGLTYFCVVLPDVVAGSWMRFLDHESMRMWLAIIALGIIWGCGTYSYKRLIIYPTPPAKKKDK